MKAHHTSPRSSLHRIALGWLLLAPLATAAQDEAGVDSPPQPPIPPGPAVLRGGGVALTIDEEAARFVVGTEGGVELVSFPIGVGIFPSKPPRVFEWNRSVDDLTLLEHDDGSGVGAAILTLRTPGNDAEIAIGARAAEGGILITFGIPGVALLGLPSPASVLSVEGMVDSSAIARPRVTIGGEPARSALVLSPPAALEIIGSELGVVGESYRLSGVVLAPDGEPEMGSLLIESGSTRMFESGPMNEVASRSFDLALRAEDRVRISVAGSGRLVLTDAMIRDSEKTVRLSELVLDAKAAIDLFFANGARIELAENAVVLDAVDGTERGVEDAVDARRDAMFVPPYMLMLRAEGHYLGIGLATLTDASAMTLSAGRLSLALPTRRLGAMPVASDPDDPENEGPRGTTLALALIAGASRSEVLERYRYALVEGSAAGALRETAAAANPTWWRHPILRLGERAPIPFDAVEIRSTVERVTSRLGFGSFTLLVDGPWVTRPGDLDSAEGFETLRSLIAQSHVENRNILLSIDAFAAAPGSYADLLGLVSDSILDTTSVKKHERYAREIARRVVSRESNGYGADGILLRNVQGMRDPASEAPVFDVAAGLGLFELKRHVEQLKVGLLAHRDDALLLAPVAVPQLVDWIDGHVIREADGDLSGAIETATAALSDQPIFIELSRDFANPTAFLDSLATAVVFGTPIVDAHRMLDLDDHASAVAAGLLALAVERPLGVPARSKDGRPQMKLDGRVLAEMLSEGRAVAVYPARDRASVVLLEDGAIELPFAPSVAPDGVEISFASSGAVLKNGRAGVVYRFTR